MMFLWTKLQRWGGGGGEEVYGHLSRLRKKRAGMFNSKLMQMRENTPVQRIMMNRKIVKFGVRFWRLSGNHGQFKENNIS